MKLSQITGDRCFTVIADLIEPVSAIAQDKAAVELFKPKQTPKGKTSQEYFLERMKEGLPNLIRGHKDELVVIMATIEGVSPESYLENLNLASFFKDLLDLFTDEEFLSFLS